MTRFLERYRASLQHFARVTSTGRYLPEIDGLRFIAIGSVLLFHLRAYVGAKSPIAWQTPLDQDPIASALLHLDRGVPVFFAISGFVLSLPFASARLRGGALVPIKSYLLRRLTRLEPPYLLSVFAFAALLVATKPAVLARDIAPHVVASMFYVHNALYQAPSLVNVVYWSLEVEVQFYLLAPLFGAVFLVRPRAVRRSLVALLATLAEVAKLLLLEHWAMVKLTLLGSLPCFLVGVLLADVYVDDWNEAPTRHVAFDIVSVVAWSLLLLVTYDDRAERFLFPILLFIAFAGSLRSVHVRSILTTAEVTALGGMCYSIYLIHYQLISLVGRFAVNVHVGRTFASNLILQCFLTGVPVLALSSVYFILIEKPCMRRDWPARALAALNRCRPRGSKTL